MTDNSIGNRFGCGTPGSDPVLMAGEHPRSLWSCPVVLDEPPVQGNGSESDFEFERTMRKSPKEAESRKSFEARPRPGPAANCQPYSGFMDSSDSNEKPAPIFSRRNWIAGSISAGALAALAGCVSEPRARAPRRRFAPQQRDLVLRENQQSIRGPVPSARRTACSGGSIISARATKG